MFGWFTPKCPLGTWEKTWTETRMRWLADKLGLQRLLDAEVILPTDEYFPEPYTGKPEDARRFLDKLADYMDLDASKIELEVCADVELPGAAGHYDAGERKTIRIAASQLAGPQSLMATLAHELAHEMLLGGGLLTTDVQDHEWITDLLPVYLGLGVFAANSVMSEKYWSSGQLSWWTMGKHGYLPARIFGYAFALFCFMREEDEPTWTHHLRLDAAVPLKDGLRFLYKTNDSLFHPKTISQRKQEPPLKDLVAQMETGSASFRLAALWDIRARLPNIADAVPALARCLSDRDEGIASEAASVLGQLGPAADLALPSLRAALWDGPVAVRVAAIRALGPMQRNAAEVIPELIALLGETSPAILGAAAAALRHFGPDAAPALERLLDVFRQSLIAGDDAMIGEVAGAVANIAPNVDRRLRLYFDADEELLALAREAVKEQQEQKRTS